MEQNYFCDEGFVTTEKHDGADSSIWKYGCLLEDGQYALYGVLLFTAKDDNNRRRQMSLVKDKEVYFLVEEYFGELRRVIRLQKQNFRLRGLFEVWKGLNGNFSIFWSETGIKVKSVYGTFYVPRYW